MNKPAAASPPPPARLENRDTSDGGPLSRTYVCKSCGTATAVGDSSLTHVVNPLRMTTASICAGCGPTPLEVLHWADTNESVAAFRKRMWRLTPTVCKLVHFLIIPGLLGLLGAAAVPGDVIEGQALWIGRAVAFGAVYLVILLILWMTPLAGAAPAMCGVKYHLYR